MGRNSDGYGIAWRQRTHGKAHRVAWELFRGPIPHGLCVLHSCDNPPCCNPEHLRLGTVAENNAERARKGRSAIRRGEAHNMARLTADDVSEMRRLYARGITQVRLADAFGVKQAHVSRILLRRVWAHIP